MPSAAAADDESKTRAPPAGSFLLLSLSREAMASSAPRVLLVSFLLALMIVANSPAPDEGATEGLSMMEGEGGGFAMGAPAPMMARSGGGGGGSKMHRRSKRSADAGGVAPPMAPMAMGAASMMMEDAAQSESFASSNAAAVRSSVQEMASVRDGDSGTDPTALQGTVLIKDAQLAAEAPDAAR